MTRQISRPLVLLALVPAAALSSQAPAQDLSRLNGMWTGVCSSCAPNAMPGDFSKKLLIQVRESAVAVTRDSYPIELYPIDGTEVRLVDGRTAHAIVDGETVVLTTTRTRRTADGEYRTNVRDVYRVVSPDTLTVERSARGSGPGDTRETEWVSVRAVNYTR